MVSKDFIKFCFDVGIKHFRIGQSIINKNHACNTYKFFHINMRKHCWKDIIKICNNNRVVLDAKLFDCGLNTVKMCGSIYIDEPIYK